MKLEQQFVYFRMCDAVGNDNTTHICVFCVPCWGPLRIISPGRLSSSGKWSKYINIIDRVIRRFESASRKKTHHLLYTPVYRRNRKEKGENNI